MTYSTITSKGQTTVPAKLRAMWGLNAGDRIEYIAMPGGQILLKPLIQDVRTLKGMLEKPKKPVSIDQMNQAIRRRGNPS